MSTQRILLFLQRQEACQRLPFAKTDAFFAGLATFFARIKEENQPILGPYTKGNARSQNLARHTALRLIEGADARNQAMLRASIACVA